MQHLQLGPELPVTCTANKTLSTAQELTLTASLSLQV